MLINEYSLTYFCIDDKIEIKNRIKKGTSLTALIVAGDLAEIIQVVPDEDVLLAEILLYHGAHQFWEKDDMEKDAVVYF